MMNNFKVLALVLVCFAVGFLACVKHEVSFSGRSEIKDDGTIERKGSLQIRVAGDRDIAEDSLRLTEFYDDNYVAPDEFLFEVSREYLDSALMVSWEGTITPENLPVSDYVHKSKEGPNAINSVSIVEKNRWIFEDMVYTEIFSDPVDTARYFPMIRSQLSQSSNYILSHDALKGIGDRERADDLLDRMETDAGLELFKRILEDPAGYDTVSNLYDNQISIISDSLAGFAGVKQDPETLNELIHETYDAAWDTLLSDHPGLFGSFAFDDIDIHSFMVEVSAPGCIISSNSDTTTNGLMAWTFNRMDFFAHDYEIKVVARNWRWINIAITLIVIAIILFIILGPVRKSRAS